jgi:hypothetical protein
MSGDHLPLSREADQPYYTSPGRWYSVAKTPLNSLKYLSLFGVLLTVGGASAPLVAAVYG